MKPEHKEKLLTQLEGIENSNKMLSDIINGAKPGGKETAIELTRKIGRLLELSRNIVDIA